MKREPIKREPIKREPIKREQLVKGAKLPSRASPFPLLFLKKL